MNGRVFSLMWFCLAAALGLLDMSSAWAQEFYKGKTIALYAGQPPGGGIDNEMRLVAQFYAKHIPGDPNIAPMYMPGAGGIVLANYISNISKPDGLTIAMPGRSGFVLASIIKDKNAKYALNDFKWIGSSGAPNRILWLRKEIRIRSLDELRNAKQQVVIGGLSSTTSDIVVPMVLAKYEGLPMRSLSGYPGLSEAKLALQRGEIDGIFAAASTFSPDLISSGDIVPIFQTFMIEPNVPTIEEMISNDKERALMNLVLGPDTLGAPLLAPPGMPDNVTSILRAAYTEMVTSDEYRASAAVRAIDVTKPVSGEGMQKYVATKLSSVAADTIQEYLSYVGTK